jgi:hypothetical protein
MPIRLYIPYFTIQSPDLEGGLRAQQGEDSTMGQDQNTMKQKETQQGKSFKK